MGQMIPKEMKYNLLYGEVRGDVLRPPRGTIICCSVVKKTSTDTFVKIPLQMILKEMKYNLHYGEVRGDVLRPATLH